MLDKQFGIVSEFDRQVAYTVFVGVCVCTCERVNVKVSEGEIRLCAFVSCHVMCTSIKHVI